MTVLFKLDAEELKDAIKFYIKFCEDTVSGTKTENVPKISPGYQKS